MAALAVTALVTAAAITTAAVTERPAAAPLDRFQQQSLNWRSCDDPGLDGVGAQCADVTVPLNYAEPQGRTIVVAISRIPATDPSRRHGVMLSNPGGPGGAGLDYFVETSKAMTPEVRARYDLIGMDPRGVGRSSAVNCHWPHGFGLQFAGPDAGSFAESVADQADLAARCAAVEGDRLPHFTTRNTARDMDVIRAVLGQDKISYLGTSYGTYLGAVYMQMFPERSDRMVLDGTVDPYRYGAVGMVQDMGAPNEAALDAWAAWTAERDGEYHLGATGAEVRGAVQRLIERAAVQPIRIGDFELNEHMLPLVLYIAFDSPHDYGLAAQQIRELADAADGTPVRPDADLAGKLGIMLRSQPRDLSPQMAILCGDVGVPRDPAWYRRNLEASRAAQPVFGALADNITPCAFWAPPIETPTALSNSVPNLIIQATGDTRTNYGGALAMHKVLTGSRMVTLRDVAIHSILGRYPNACVYDAVNTYLADGILPAADLTCRED
ncbi:alpha/beta fold hydrolase [Nocardia sp. ET3-3]|uniref:Alpha/beta fold hydrolase n=1 Tax=Nocardia terrae TaxID=2675851 RepID=A0A7K1UZ69_9NOCA|nr:alpha/beta hydrolase [Nocardia terrae]MVU79686.1 alpha/beta fold hydrolase [Nocardia terrae]